jgi:biotin carboxyl carrier protein
MGGSLLFLHFPYPTEVKKDRIIMILVLHLTLLFALGPLASAWHLAPKQELRCASAAARCASSRLFVAEEPLDTEGGADGDWWDVDDLEVMQGEGDDFDVEEWIPDREVARRRKEQQPIPKYPTAASAAVSASTTSAPQPESKETQPKASPYTDEEEEVIAAMGGKQMGNNKREAGFLGDCTLQEIAMDYSVPICYLADVLCMWGVPVPIDIHNRLGDLVTGEQAFAIIEAVYSVDVGALHDRYSNQNLVQVCYEFDIEMKDGFQFAMKEGWSLPFGVQTNLRVEQEDELIRVLSPH